MVCDTKKGSLFFTVDTMIGALILVFTIIIVVSVYAQPHETREPRTILENTVTFMVDQDMQSLQQNHQFTYTSDIEDFEDYRLHQKIAYLHDNGEASRAESFVANITRLTVPDHLGVVYEYNGTVIYRRGDVDGNYNSQLSRTVLTHYRQDQSTIIGPYQTIIKVLS